MGHHNIQDMAKEAKKLAKYSDLQEQLGNELPLHAARLKFIVLLITALIWWQFLIEYKIFLFTLNAFFK